jgi:FKBP-type peptidyl-prolyl cis-trans isomerase FkpA
MKSILLAAVGLLVLAACGQETPPPAAEAVDHGDVGVRVIRNGYGRAVEPGDELTVHTTGWLYDESQPDHRGEKFWSSQDTGNRLTFILGAGQMIKGWDLGLPGMLIGEVRELTIPPELGYGSDGRGPIPPDSTLVFEVELFAASAPDEAGDGD